MKNKKWNVTFSVGIVTFENFPSDVKQAINIADELMYSVKKNKKNEVYSLIHQYDRSFYESGLPVFNFKRLYG